MGAALGDSQTVTWHSDDAGRGRFCRIMLAAEQRGASAAMLAQACALEDSLGLTSRALQRLWEVVDDEPPPPGRRDRPCMSALRLSERHTRRRCSRRDEGGDDDGQGKDCDRRGRRPVRAMAVTSNGTTH